MSPEAQARKPNYTTFHSSVINWNNSARQWGPLREMMLPYYFVWVQCFHKFRLGAEPSAVFFQGLYFPCPFPQISLLSSFLSFCRWTHPALSSPALAGLGQRRLLCLLKHVCIIGTFSTPLGPNVLCIWPWAAFCILWWEATKNHAAATSSHITGCLYIIAIVITGLHSLRVMCTSMSLNENGSTLQDVCPPKASPPSFMVITVKRTALAAYLPRHSSQARRHYGMHGPPQLGVQRSTQLLYTYSALQKMATASLMPQEVRKDVACLHEKMGGKKDIVLLIITDHFSIIGRILPVR